MTLAFPIPHTSFSHYFQRGMSYANLFILLIEHGDDEDENRGHAALEHAWDILVITSQNTNVTPTKEETKRKERSERRGCCVTHQDDAPGDNVCAEVLRDLDWGSAHL